MPTAREHRKQAEHDEHLALRCAENFPDWALTALHYAALHWVEAYFEATAGPREPAHYLDDVEREAAILRRISQEAYQRYRFLAVQSRSARYGCVSIPREDVNVARQKFYEPLRDFIVARLP